MQRSGVIFWLITSLLLLGACSSPPSEEQLAEAILTAIQAEPDIEVTPVQATCMAQNLLESGLSKTTLSGLASDFDNPEVLKSESEQVKDFVASAALTCVGS